MPKPFEGTVIYGKFENADAFNWLNQETKETKLLRSLKVLLPFGDGTVDRVSISLPDDMSVPELKKDQVYGFAVMVGWNHKKQELKWTLRADVPPFPQLQTP